MDLSTLSLGLAGGAAVGVAGVFIIQTLRGKRLALNASEILAAAQEKARRTVEEAEFKTKEEVLRLRGQFEKETVETRTELKNLERRLEKREDGIEQKATSVQKRERQLESIEKSLEDRTRLLDERGKEIDRILTEQKDVLQRLAGLTRDEAVATLMQRVEKEMDHEVAARVHKAQELGRESAEVEARRIITVAIQRWAAEHTAETTVSIVDLPNEEMKGRIIGREGRNIRAFERATGCDVIVDDTPGVVVVSAFDGTRREMARRSMEKLVQDGRIHPTRIEEVVESSKKEIEEHIMQVGKQLCFDLEIHGMHPKLLMLLGRLKFRTSYGQNVLQHIQEVAHLTSSMAAELGLDPILGRRCGLLHDIGKAVDQEMEGSHPAIGGEILKRFNERPEVIDAAAGHHNEANADFPYTVLAAAADAISASRPGARRESFERYVKRLERLEAIAKAHAGVDSAYAIQAGRELRVIANSTKLDDAQALLICREIAKQIENELNYPGEIKVTMLRETRMIEYAR